MTITRLMRVACGFVLGVLCFACAALGQTTGQISGLITDATGATVPGAEVELRSVSQNTVSSTKTNDAGLYLFAFVQPGLYQIKVHKPGFKQVDLLNIIVNLQAHVEQNVALQLGSVSESVTVDATAQLIQPSNPNTTTTLNSRQLADLPNPGNDLSYVANFSPGAIVNTGSTIQFGSGNVQFNGLPSVANSFSIDGLDANDAYFNTNATGASGLQLGLNAVEEVSINTASYSVAQGRQEAAQINFITKSGTNNFHGNIFEIWNGSAMNARNFFNNAKGITKKPRSNVNQFGASVGGPILKNKLFFFTDVEGIRIILPTTLTSTLPTLAYQTFVLQQLPLGGTDSSFGVPLPPQPGEVPLYKNLFALMGDTSGGIPLAALGCPFDVGGGPPAIPNDGNGCAATRTFSVAPPISETLLTLKLDYTLSPKDTFWFRFQLNNGSNILPDPVSSVFDLAQSGPVRSGAAGWTHVFSPELVNQFNPGISYNSLLQGTANSSKASAFPLTFNAAPFSTLGGFQTFGTFFSANTTWQLNDNLAWNRGKHSLKFGEDMRRVLISASPTSQFAIPQEFGCNLSEFTFGATCFTTQSFPKTTGDRLALINFDLYAMDIFRVTRKLTLTIGVRTAWNSNPVSQHKAFSRLASSFETISRDVNQPLNQVIIPNQEHPFESTPALQWQPRVALAYEVQSNTVLRAGFGIFATTLEGILSNGLAQNPPSAPKFNGGIFGSVGGTGLIAGVPNSAVDAAAAANQQFQAGFAGGALSCASPLASPSNCIPAANFTAFSGGRQEYPYSMQWSSAIEHQFPKDFGLTVRYQGTHAVKTFFVLNSANGYQAWCQGCFAPLPFNAAPDARFSQVSAFNTGANSSYHALQVTGQKRMSHGLSFQLNYTYSHCLDTISNGGDLQFNAASGVGPFSSNLKRYYGHCDYDIRHSINGWYLYELPVHSKKAWLEQVIGGWQVSGTVFLRGGFPISVFSSGNFANFFNGSPTLLANLVPGQNPYSRTPIQGVTQPGTIQWLNPNAFQSVIDTSVFPFTCFSTTNVQNCQDGKLARNAFRAPSFKWTDLDIGKRFKVSEKLSFRFDAQFYNLFNHPNFYYPNFGSPFAGIPGKPASLTGFGTISQTASPQTGLLGGKRGGDSSVRMIAFRGRIEF